MTQRMIEIISPFFISEERLAACDDPQDLFGSFPLHLEIGCGLGDFVVELAARTPEKNFLAVDIYNKGCLKTCRKVESAGLTNVRVMRIEARSLLTRYLPPESLAAVYINCPDPWPKKRHRRRRLVDETFMRLLLRQLRAEGELFFTSDFADYAEDVAGMVATVPGWRNCLNAPHVCVRNLSGYPVSKYMRRFLDRGEPVHHVHARRERQLPAVSLPRPEWCPGFRSPAGIS